MSNDAASREVPVIANIRPSGDTYLMEDFYYAGGLPALMSRLAPFLDQVTITRLRVRDRSVDLRFDRHAFDVGVTVLSRTGSVEVIVIK